MLFYFVVEETLLIRDPTFMEPLAANVQTVTHVKMDSAQGIINVRTSEFFLSHFITTCSFTD
jgi:hypothetical protein